MENISSNFNNDSSREVISIISKKTFYIWLFAILANVGTYLTIVNESITNGHFGTDAFFSPIINSGNLTFLGISLFISIIPTLLSGLNFKWRNYIGYGIPIIIILYSVWHFYTCTGKFCNIVDIPIAIGGFIFAVFYALGVYLRKWNGKIILSLLWIEIILLVGGFAFIIYHSQLNSESKAKISALQEESQDVTTPIEIGKTCDSIPVKPYDSYNSDCWQRAMKLYPNTDVCSWSKEANSKNQCLFYQGLLYRENLEYGCEDKDSQTSYNKKDDPSENTRLLQCWADKAKIYPELNICQWTYEWNREKCTAYFKTTSQ